jgi:hypothetical protein
MSGGDCPGVNFVSWALAVAALILAQSAPLNAQRSDTTVVQAAGPRHPGVAALVEELTLGNGIDADEYRFTNAFVHGGANGMVYVVDVRDPTNVGAFRSDVRQYDRAGKFVRAFGRTGQGPGEYTGHIADVGELPDGRVVLADAQGLLVYSATGEPLARWNAKALSANAGMTILVDPAGFVSVYGGIPGDTLPYIHRFRFNGTAVDTTLAPDAIFAPAPRVGLAMLPYGPRHVATWSPLGYFVTALTSRYAIDLRVPPISTGNSTRRVSIRGAAAAPLWRPGDPVRSIRHSVPAVHVQEDERRDWRQSITMFNRNGRGTWRTWEWSGPDVPRVKPPLRNLHVDTHGRIWVQLSQPSQLNKSVAIPTNVKEAGDIAARHRWTEPLVFDVFEPGGTYVGRVRFPDGVGVSALGPKAAFTIKDDTVWAVSRDHDDVPHVKRYRIDWRRK